MKRLVFLILGLLIFSPMVAASYAGMLRELDVRIVCLLVWAAPLVALILLSIGGLLLIIADTSWKRDHAKSMIYNTIIGLVIVFGFIFVAGYLGNLDLTRCLGEVGKPPEKPIIEPEVTTTSIVPPSCSEFFDDCEKCLENNCFWCFDSGGCYSEEECESKCEFEEEDVTYKGTCTKAEEVCSLSSQGEISGEYISEGECQTDDDCYQKYKDQYQNAHLMKCNYQTSKCIWCSDGNCNGEDCTECGGTCLAYQDKDFRCKCDCPQIDIYNFQEEDVYIT